MTFLRKFSYLLPWRRRAQEQDMREELEALAAIAGPKELGNLTTASEAARAQWGWIWLEQLWQDVQYARRTMRRSPGLSATVILSLALGIGANTAIFSLFDALMLRWLPVRDPQELFHLEVGSKTDRSTDDAFSYRLVKTLAEQRDLFSGVAGSSAGTFQVGLPGSIRPVPGAWVTGGYYETLGLNPVLGRLLTFSDDQTGAPLAAVISYGYWERQYSRDPHILEQTLRISGAPVAIVGVSPPGFTGANVGSIADITLPVSALPVTDPPQAGLLQPGNSWLRILVRPRPEISLPQWKARVAALWPSIVERTVSPTWPLEMRKQFAEAPLVFSPGGTGYSRLREIFRQPLLILMASVAVVLLIACANVASLMLANAAARRREVSVRLALGAGRGRIVRQLLTESVLLSLVGAVLGTGLAWLTARLLVGNIAAMAKFDVTPNAHVLLFTIGVSITSAVLFGLVPALQTTAGGPAPVLKDDTRMTPAGSRLLSMLVAAQVSLSLMLLIGAGLFVGTLRNLLTINPGFHREGVLLVDLDPPQPEAKGSTLAFYRNLLDLIRRTPGVVSASISSHSPLDGATWSEAVMPKGQPLPKRDNAVFIAAGPGFFETLRTPLLQGRGFDARDEGSPAIAIVNRTFATLHFPGQNPVGQYLTATVTQPPSDLQIAGVVEDSLTSRLQAAPRPTVYVSYFHRASHGGFLPGTTIEIYAAGSMTQVAEAVRQIVQQRRPNSAVEVRSLDEQVKESLMREKLLANLAGGFGIVGLSLACVGLYGLLAYSVSRRIKEIGIRMALGAHRGRVQWMVIRDALRLLGLGIAVGLPVAWLLSRGLRSMLFGLTPSDPRVLLAAVLLLSVAGLTAAYIPARKGSRVDPMTALRHD